MNEKESLKKPEVNLGKAAVFMAVVAVLGLATSTMGIWFYGFIGVLAGIAAIGLGSVWFVTRRAVNKSASND